ncbi:hypothetical protein GPJ56_003086 [Histomonas meleagridis]|uniref:uncharacterized protein n=1 Tax=Histomonas meleagridis TaxID=135588 RepID=UPI00355AABBA|nr:hypothetical protein GPJ56_003086 [Histomonas meleagridis]KAH0805141.1 hypothetical protein GO595_002086 [Histomonas meleagridis]
MSFADSTSQIPIQEFPCFLVQKVSHNGSLILFTENLLFRYSDGEECPESKIPYSEITDIKIEAYLANTVQNLEIHTQKKTLVFSALQEAQQVKEYINLLKDQKTRQSTTYGFSLLGQKTVKYEELQNPNLLCSFKIPAPFEKVMQYICTKESFQKLYEGTGDEDVVISDWTQYPTHDERTFTYKKLVSVPVIGQSLILVSEVHKLFHFEDRDIICTFSDLGATPYSAYFDPLVQMIYINNGDSVEFILYYEIVWSESVFVKSIIESKTIAEFNVLYNCWYKQIVKDVCGKDIEQLNADTKPSDQGTPAPSKNKFQKYRRYYKITIIILSLMVIFALLRYNWPEDGLKWNAKNIYKILVGLCFVYVMVYY